MYTLKRMHFLNLHKCTKIMILQYTNVYTICLYNITFCTTFSKFTMFPGKVFFSLQNVRNHII